MSKVFIVTMLSSATIEAPITVLPHHWREVEEDPAQTIATQQAEIEALQQQLDRLANAVRALPVEEWVETATRQTAHGDPEEYPQLIGYVMQATGEWDAVREALPEMLEASQGKDNGAG